MSSLCVDFSDIKLIICVQGYPLTTNYVIREIGFWSKDISGSIPFNVKINKDKLDIKSQQIISNAEETIHGMKMKKSFDFGIAGSEFKAVLKTLFNMVNDNLKGGFIGVQPGDRIIGYLHASGLGNYVTDLDYLNVIQKANLKCPDDEMIRNVIKQHPEKFKVCSLHESLNINEPPLCAKVKAEIIANYCQSIAKSFNDKLQLEFASIVKDLDIFNQPC